MRLDSVLKLARKQTMPSEKEKSELDILIKKIIEKINSLIRKQKIPAKIIAGGSAAKGTWLPGISDIDFFMLFSYKKYNDKSKEISDICEKILKKAFVRIKRLCGSRDYFSAKIGKFNIEIVPVIEIQNIRQMKNITDASPLHVKWILEKIRKKSKLSSEIRLAKQFFKANRIYGAESFIRGLSGHVIEILVIHYCSFEGLLKAILRWKVKEVIDVGKKYKSQKDAFEKINASKLESPLIVVDPVEPYRNSAAALCMEKFALMKKAAHKFLKYPSLEFFKEKKVSEKELIRKKRAKKLIILKANPEKGKADIVGSRLLKNFEFIKKELVKNDFVVIESGWFWDEKNPALYWFYLGKKQLSKTIKHFGPPLFAKPEHISEFRKAWARHKILEKHNRIFVELPRKYMKPEILVRNLLRKMKGLRMVYAK